MLDVIKLLFCLDLTLYLKILTFSFILDELS